MKAEQLTGLRNYQWMPRRIPALDALMAFVPEDFLGVEIPF